MRKLKLDELNRMSQAEYEDADKLPVVVVLDNIRSAHNVGALFRTADGFAIEQLILCGISARPPHKEINKTAIGATNTVLWEYEEDICLAISGLRSKGYMIIGVEQIDKKESLMDFHFPKTKPIAIVLGNEVDGISDAIIPLLDVALEIPQYGTKHSFNVSVCGGMVLWEISKQLRS